MRPILSLLLVAAAITSPVASAQTVTTLLRSGANAAKRNLVIIGDGYTTAQQAAFNSYVDTVVIRDLFHETNSGVYRETMNAYNIFRVNANSAATGVTTVDAAGNVTNAVNTFWDYRFSGLWARCWMERGPTSLTRVTAALDTLVPGWDYVFVVLNTTSFGGCRRGSELEVTAGVTWTVAAHEMGHMTGNLGDEYTGTANYAGAEPSAVNLTRDTNRTTLKWRAFVDPATAVPTAAAGFTGDPVADAGLFAGATTGGTRFGTGIYRPSVNDRMNGNTPDFDPVCYDQMQTMADPFHEYVFQRTYTGKFTNDKRDDVVLHNANSLALYAGAGSMIDPQWVRTMPDPIWDAYRSGDRFFVGDFDGDGMDDLFVFNAADWSMPYFAMLRATGNGFEGVRRFDGVLPGWGDMKLHDQFHVADVDGDGKDDIVVFNGQDWAVGYLLILKSTGSNLTYVTRYDEELPGWDDMKRNDMFFVGDFNGDKMDDLYVFNGRDWSVGYLEMLKGGPTGFTYVRRYDEELPGWDDMKPNDRFFVADFDADGRKDLYVFNGPDWSMSYLAMLRSTGTSLASTRRFDGSVPGWGEMRRRDQWYVADVNGDKKEDLYVYNSRDWATEYLGTMRSSGTNLGGAYQSDWIGSWNLGQVDRFAVMNFNGGAGWDDLVVFNDRWFGLLRSRSTSVKLNAIYRDWIHNHNYHSQGLW